jgi:hypothetical protein
MPETWVFVAIAALLFAHVVLVAFVIRRTGAYSVSGVDTDELFDGSESVDLAESAGGDSRGAARSRARTVAWPTSRSTGTVARVSASCRRASRCEAAVRTGGVGARFEHFSVPPSKGIHETGYCRAGGPRHG